MLRLFVGLALPAAAAARIMHLHHRLPGARWIAPENLHITIAFIGDVETPQAEDIHNALSVLRCPAPTLRLKDLGSFGEAHRSRALWLGIDPPRALDALHERVAAALRRARVKLEKRRFTPHVTIARLGEVEPTAMASLLNRNIEAASAPFTPEALTLFRSYRGRDGAHYEALESYPLLMPAPVP